MAIFHASYIKHRSLEKLEHRCRCTAWKTIDWINEHDKSILPNELFSDDQRGSVHDYSQAIPRNKSKAGPEGVNQAAY